MKHALNTVHRAILLALPGLLPATAAMAEIAVDVTKAENAPDGLPAIIVTADKIARPLEDVPASVAVIAGQDLEQSHITGMEKLEGRVPGLSFQPFGQAGLNAPVMRGLTANFNAFSTSTLLLVDGVPQHTAQGFEDAMIDVDRIEILRGPQSTLYGRNAEAGVIAIYSLPMDETPRASVSAEMGSRDKRAARLSLSQPLVEDRLYASLSGSWLKQDGFISNINSGGKADDRERRNLKFGLRWTPSAVTDLVLRYAFQDYDDGAALWGAPTATREQVASGTDSWNRSKGQSLSLNASHLFDNGLQLRSVTAWSDFNDDIQQDTDFMPADITHIRRDHDLRTLSQEFRLEDRLGTADWLTGLYLDHHDNDLHNVGRRMRQVEDLRADLDSRAMALFTHWNVPLSDRWTLAAGARVERTRVKIEPKGAASQDRDWTQLTPKLALHHQFSAEHQWYASVSRGVRSGGFNALSAASNFAAFQPEDNWSYETGLKGWAWGKRLRYSAAAYIMDIKDMQVLQMPMPGVMYITSAATATSKGLEAELDYLLGDGWQLRTGISWNRTRFDRFRDGAADYAGNANPFVPALTGHVGLRYDAPQGWYAEASMAGAGKVHLDAANQYRRNGYHVINMVAGYRIGDWEISGYINNLSEKTHDAVGYQNGFVTVYSLPREAGLRLTWRM